MQTPRKYSFEAAREKMVAWTNKSERAHSEVRKKLTSWSIPYMEREQIIVYLIELNLINEQRYAEAYAMDKFRFNKWGRQKIAMHLKSKGISDRNIQDALKRIPNEDQSSAIREIAERKWSTFKGLQAYQRKMKIAQHLLRRGYDPEMVWRELNKINSDQFDMG